MPQAAFTVSAINLQRDENRTYGPFPGYPHITYEFVRCQGDTGDHIFTYENAPRADQMATDGSDEGWIAEDGEFIPGDAWRRCYNTSSSFAYPAGPFWSDLSFHQGTVPDDYVWASDFNDLSKFDPLEENHLSNPITKSDYDAREEQT